MRRRTDRLFVTTLGPREREALDLIEKRPGLTVADLADTLGVGMTRAWQIVGRLESGRVRRERK
jgi:uncharacterized membrane protein